MVFSSLVFLFRFLPVVLLLYYVTPRRFRNLVLFLASLFFYAWGEPVYVCLLLFSSLLDYAMGRLIGASRKRGLCGWDRAALVISLVVNLSLLAVFKYADFFLETLGAVSGMQTPPLSIALPIGISFYTFQTLSYTIDVYRGRVRPQHNFITFASYVALFPQLIAGPIVRYATVEAELDSRRETVDDFAEGVCRFVAGLGKKVLIANRVGTLFTEIAALAGGELSSLTAWLGVVAFTLQIYFDFSGYSDMAIGLGRMFGFHFLENFEHPYESKSITEFWRRWHISLGTWFKEYVYIPLGGNRKGIPRQLLNIAIVWFLTGLWHGASWNFVLWGVYYGILLVIEKLFTLRLLQKAGALWGHVYTMVLVTVGWAFFCYPDLRHPGEYVRALTFGASAGVADERFWYLLLSNLILLLLAAVGATTLPKRAGEFLAGKLRFGKVLRPVGVLLCMALCVIFLVSDSFNPFLYFRF